MKTKIIHEHIGITYPKIFSNRIMWWLWKRFMCPKGKHLFDEVSSWDGKTRSHYLYCDACQKIYINISSIEVVVDDKE